MPAEVFEEPIEFEIAILEAVDPGSPGFLAASYPWPSLKPTTSIEKRTFRSVVLENRFLRAAIVPDLGGRLISLHDKRSGTDILACPPRLIPKEGGSRGAYLAEGAQIVARGGPRSNSLGPTWTLLEHADDDASPAGVWIGEVAGHLSLNALWSIEAEEASLCLEVRFLNRRLETTPYNGGVSVWWPDSEVLRWGPAIGLYSGSRDAGLALLPSDLPMEAAVSRELGISLVRAPTGSRPVLAPRQADTFSIRMVPWSGIGKADAVSLAGAIARDDAGLRLQSTRPRIGNKLVLLTDGDGSLEATLDLDPNVPFALDFDSLPSRPKAAVLLDNERQEVLRFEPEHEVTIKPPADFWTSARDALAALPRIGPTDGEATLRSATASVLTRTLAHLLLGAKRLAEERFEEADEEFGNALLFNGNDPLAWWSKSLAKRKSGELGELPELLNAHFLAPLEPALRVESFLGQKGHPGITPSPVLAPLADDPGQFLDVACLLVHLGLLRDAAVLLEEAIKHSDGPMLRYLLAYVVSTEPQMAVEAAQHVRAASALGFHAPYPWREEELQALRALGRLFPGDELIAKFSECARSMGETGT